MARRWSFMMGPLEHGSLRWMNDIYGGLLMPGGQALFWGALTSGILLLGGLAGPLLTFFSLSTALLLVAWALGLPFAPQVSLQRMLSTFPAAGEVLRYAVVVRNLGPRTLRHLTVQERDLPSDLRPVGEPAVVEQLLPGAQTTVTLSLLCKRRGAYVLRALQAASSFPTGLMKRATTSHTQDRLLVYPAWTPLESFDVPHGRNHQPGGMVMASQLGDSTEFFGARDWRSGDRPRDVHWPSLARTGQLIVKEFQQEYFIRLALVVDLEMRWGRHEAAFERGLSLAAGIANALARQDYIVDLFFAGPGVYHFQAGRALAHFENILEILAGVEPGARLNLGALELALVPQAQNLSGVVLVMMDWEPQRQALVQRLKDQGVAVRVLSVRPDRPATGLAPDEAVVLS